MGKQFVQRMDGMKESIQTKKRSSFHHSHDIDDLMKAFNSNKAKYDAMSDKIAKLLKKENASNEKLKKIKNGNNQKQKEKEKEITAIIGKAKADKIGLDDDRKECDERYKDEANRCLNEWIAKKSES